MHSFMIFTKKEFMELWRTKRILILCCAFLFLAIGSPILGRYLAEIIQMTAGDLPIEFPPPFWLDSWAQFYSNFNQLGNLVVIVLFMGCISGEKQSGTASLALTKNLSHTSFVMAKFFSQLAILTGFYIVAIGVAQLYTELLFDTSGNIMDVILGGVFYYVGLVALLAFITLASSLTKSSLSSVMVALGGGVLAIVVSYLPGLRNFSPQFLMSQSMEVLVSGGELEFPVIPLLGTIVVTVLCLVGAIYVLKGQEI